MIAALARNRNRSSTGRESEKRAARVSEIARISYQLIRAFAHRRVKIFISCAIR